MVQCHNSMEPVPISLEHSLDAGLIGSGYSTLKSSIGLERSTPQPIIYSDKVLLSRILW